MFFFRNSLTKIYSKTIISSSSGMAEIRDVLSSPVNYGLFLG